MPLVKPDQKYTYQDYLTWEDDERWELIDGFPYNMSPAPLINHQTILLNLVRKIDPQLQGKACTLLLAPVDVVLSEYDVVQPDVIVVCDEKKITKKNITGAPDLLIEILSPSTAKKDRLLKRNLYEKFGVKEYLIVDPEAFLLECYRLNQQQAYGKSEIYGEKDEFRSSAIQGLSFLVNDIFESIG